MASTKTAKRGLIGQEDLSTGTGTFSRTTSVGGTQILTKISSGVLTTGNLYSIRFVDGVKFAQTRAGIQAAIDDLPARGGLVIIPTPFTLDGTTLTVGSNGTGDPRTTGKSVMLYFANVGVWSGTANPMFTLADRSGIEGLGRSTYLQNTGASGARLVDIAHAAEHVIVRDLGLVSKGPAIKAQGSIPGAKWSNLFIQVDSGSGIETQMWNDTAEASGIFINHTSATGSCWRNGVTGTGGGLEWGQNNASIRDITCQMSTVGAGPALHWESDGGTQNTYGTGIIENIQILTARKEAIKVVGFGTGPLRISNVKIGTPTLDAGTWDAITVTGSPSALTGVTLEGISGGTLTAYRYTVNWTSSGDGNRIKNVNAAAGTATLNVSGRFIVEDIAGVFAGVRAERLESNVATGTAPLVVASTTKVANLNADLLDDLNSATAATASTIAARDSGGDLTARREKVAGISIGVSDFFLSAGWGSTASVSAVTASSKDAAGEITVTSSGTGQAANPTITFTFNEGTWTTAPFAQAQQTGGTGAIANITHTRTATTLVMTWRGTPVDTSTYIISWSVRGV